MEFKHTVQSIVKKITAISSKMSVVWVNVRKEKTRKPQNRDNNIGMMAVNTVRIFQPFWPKNTGYFWKF